MQIYDQVNNSTYGTSQNVIMDTLSIFVKYYIFHNTDDDESSRMKQAVQLMNNIL